MAPKPGCGAEGGSPGIGLDQRAISGAAISVENLANDMSLVYLLE